MTGRAVLRPYQLAMIEAVLKAMDEDGFTRLLYTLATGCGKTIGFAELIRKFVRERGLKVLVLAHRRELITQAYKAISWHCDFTDFEVGIEMADTYASSAASVVIASIHTVKSLKRLSDWKPDIIITDECHRSAAKSYKSLYKRFGVEEGRCVHIGCTATAKRTDKQSLYALKPDKSAVKVLDGRTKKQKDADPGQCVYEYHCFEYSILDAINEGWLVPVVGHVVKTQTDLSKVGKDADGDYKEAELQKAVDDTRRTILAINAWKEIASDRPTVVFCAGVEHAHHAAELWQAAGFTAAAVDGETEETLRYETLEKFRNGEIQVLCNMGIYTEGTDLPTCASVVHLRPTQSWNLYVQMTGRGTRPLAGLVDNPELDADGRKAAIAGSSKPDCIVIDLVDNHAGQDLCTAPSILDIPIKMELSGQSVTEAKAKIDELEEDKELFEHAPCPATFEELQVCLEQVSLLKGSKATSAKSWRVTRDGYNLRNVQPGYRAELISEGQEWRLRVQHKGETVYDKKGAAGRDFDRYLETAVAAVEKTITKHHAKVPKGTCSKLEDKEYWALRKNNFPHDKIDCMTVTQARFLANKFRKEYRERMEAQKQTQESATSYEPSYMPSEGRYEAPDAPLQRPPRYEPVTPSATVSPEKKTRRQPGQVALDFVF